MTVRINGKDVELDGATPLLDYLAGIGVDPRSIAVEHNGEILQRDQYEKATLRDGDVVEIVRMVGGGLLLSEQLPDRGLGLGPLVPRL